MTEQKGAQSSATCNVAIAIETVSGTAEDSPDVYMIMGGDIAPVSKKPMNSKDIAGSMFPSLGWKGSETWEMTFPMLSVLEDATSPTVRRNGLGELYLALFGANTAAQIGATAAYKKTFSWEALIKTFTAWLHYATNVNERIRMNAIDTHSWKVSADGELTFDFKVLGTNLEDVLDTSYGSEAQPALATAKFLTGLGARLEFGQPGASVRTSWEELSGEMRRNLSHGAPGKDGQHPCGSGSPQIVTSTKSNIELGINLRDQDREEIKRSRAGGNIVPTASRQTDSFSLVKARVSMFGPNIAEHIHGEPDYCNAGTSVITWAGTYSGGACGTFGELEMSDSDIYETSLGAENDLAFKLLDPAATYEVVTGAAGLSVAVVAKAITVTLAAAGSTANAVLTALLANGDVTPLLTPTLANGSDGTGVITEAQAEITSANFLDGFRFRYTTGGAWSDWTAWIKVTKASAQDIVDGITADFDDDDIAAAGDKHYFYSHVRYMWRLNLPDMNYSDAVYDQFSGGILKCDIPLYHPNTGTDPTLEIVDTRITAYS